MISTSMLAFGNAFQLERGLNADRLQLLRRRLAAEIVEADEFQRCGIDLVLLGSLALASALSMVAFWYS